MQNKIETIQVLRLFAAFSVMAVVILAIAAAVMATVTGRWEQEALEKQPDFQDQPTIPSQ